MPPTDAEPGVGELAALAALKSVAEATLTGQGVALSRLPLLAGSLDKGDLVAVFHGKRLNAPTAAWLVVGPAAVRDLRFRRFVHD